MLGSGSRLPGTRRHRSVVLLGRDIQAAVGVMVLTQAAIPLDLGTTLSAVVTVTAGDVVTVNCLSQQDTGTPSIVDGDMTALAANAVN